MSGGISKALNALMDAHLPPTFALCCSPLPDTWFVVKGSTAYDSKIVAHCTSKAAAVAAWQLLSGRPWTEPSATAIGPKYDCDNCHGTGQWWDLVWGEYLTCPCVHGVAMKVKP